MNLCRNAFREAIIGTAAMWKCIFLHLDSHKTVAAQWANNLTQNANIPLPAPLKVSSNTKGQR